jgi:hypothetical protein
LLSDNKEEKYLIPRAIHSISNRNMELKIFGGLKYEFTGMLEHVVGYASVDSTGGPLELELIEELKSVIMHFREFVSIERIMITEDAWRQKVRTGSNSGLPDALTVATIDPVTGKPTIKRNHVLREDLIREYLPMIEQGEVPPETIYMAFYRTQAKKSRLVCGGTSYLKVFGAILIYAIMMSVGIFDGIAWGEYDAIFSKIVGAFAKGRTTLSVDFSKLDAKYKRRWQYILYETLRGKLQYDKTWTKFIDMYIKMIESAYIAYAPGRKFKVETGLESGRPTTQFDDSVLTKAVIMLFAKRYGFTIVDVLVLGDDVIAVFEEEYDLVVSAFKQFSEELLTETGLEVSVSKSYPCDLAKPGAFGKFLQYYIVKYGTEIFVFGDFLRRLQSIIYLERDSSVVKGIDFDAVKERAGMGTAILIRNLQIIGSLTPHMPGVIEWIAFLSIFEKDLLDEQKCKSALTIAEEHRIEVADWEVTMYNDPKWVVELIPKVKEFRMTQMQVSGIQ